MPVIGTQNPNWSRSVEPLFKAPGAEWNGPQFAGVTQGVTTAASFIASYGNMYPGYVVDVTSGGVVKATSGSNNGRAFGLLYSEVSADQDECVAKGVGPTVLKGGLCTCKVYAKALNPASTYVMDGTKNNEELIAVNGMLTPRGTDTTSHTVARLTGVDPSGAWIVVEPLAPQVSVT
ncbi:MAG: hypothetical protein JRN42_06995 [Nitrososphaerota archaeon]|nr:hypothetical protein [Nitrososphaerota archaeon]